MILSSLGELNRVVACTRYCVEVVPAVASGDRSVVADSWTSKADEILSARPDLVIAAVPYQATAVTEILKAGVRFLGLAPHTLDDIYSDIACIAGVVGARERGAAVISGMRTAIEAMRLESAGLPAKRVFCEEWGKPILTSQAWVAELVTAAGGQFLSRPGTQCSAHQVAGMDPEVIIAAWCGAGDRVPLAKMVEERGWMETAAVRTGQVYCISDELLNTPAPTLLGGLQALAGAIHPSTFGRQPGLRCIGFSARSLR